MCKAGSEAFLNLALLRVTYGADCLSSLNAAVSVKESHSLAAHCQLFSVTPMVQRKCRIPSL